MKKQAGTKWSRAASYLAMISGTPIRSRAPRKRSPNKKQLWIPTGFAHGFCVLSDVADFVYKCTEVYAPDCEQSVRWDEPALGIDWPVKEPLLSKKDLAAPLLKDVARLPSSPG